jgi:hypothetical protein
MPRRGWRQQHQGASSDGKRSVGVSTFAQRKQVVKRSILSGAEEASESVDRCFFAHWSTSARRANRVSGGMSVASLMGSGAASGNVGVLAMAG